MSLRALTAAAAALRPRRRSCLTFPHAPRAMSALPARVPPPRPPPPVPALPVSVALCQLAVSADKAANIAAATRAVADAAAAGAKLVVLPEMWNCPYGALVCTYRADGRMQDHILSLCAALRCGG
jgi:omega-amidase